MPGRRGGSSIKALDPQEAAARTRNEHRVKGSVNQLFDGYLAHMESSGKRSVKEVARSLQTDARPHLGGLPAREITPAHIRDILYRLIRRDAPVQANRLRSHLRAAFQWGVYHDNNPRSVGAEVLFQLDRNPVDAVPKDASVESVGDRALSWEEIVQIWHDERLPLIHRLAVRLLLATGGQRPGEVTEARFDEFDVRARVWTLPPSRTKNKRYHLVPLTDLAIEIVETLHLFNSSLGPFLFPARGQPPRPQNKSTLPQAVHAYCQDTEIQAWTPKDLRRTVKTRMGELGIAKAVRDHIQNHALVDVSARHYDRYDYLPEKREALETWCKHLRSVTSQSTPLQG
jgi:integrase